MIIDVHVHIRSEQMLARALRQAEQLDMILCLNSINLIGSSSPNLPSQEFITRCNDQTAAVAAAHPERVIPMWYLNPAHGRFAVAELARRVKNHRGPQGVKLWTAVKANDPRADAVFAMCADYRLPVLQHTWLEVPGNLPGETDPFDMRAAALRHPGVTFFWGHASGDVEYTVKLAPGLPNIYLDIGGCEATNGYTEMLVKYVGANHIVQGSDGTGRSFISQLAKVYAADISAEEKERILYKNAQAAFAQQSHSHTLFA
ncbi:MAG: amidohydrolase family protein [Chloroflexota bacterium]|nr:amidohydrolase family protein [Chloroflexota bacterium]